MSILFGRTFFYSFLFYFTTALFFFMLFFHSYFFQYWIVFALIAGPLSMEQSWIGSLLLRHIQLLQFNAHEVSELQMERPRCLDGAKTLFLGAAVYPTVWVLVLRISLTRWNVPQPVVSRHLTRSNQPSRINWGGRYSALLWLHFLANDICFHRGWRSNKPFDVVIAN